MRFFAVLVSASVLYQLGSAIPIPERNVNELASREDAFDLYSRYDNTQVVLEARGHGEQHKNTNKPAPKPEVKIRTGDSRHDAANTLDRLNLHAANRKQTENWHKNVVAGSMPPGTHSAEVVNLAHSKGSNDPKIHVTGQYKDKDGNIIQTPRFGNPKQLDDKAHLYIGNPNDHPSVDAYNQHAHSQLPEPYKKAVAKANGEQKSKHTMF